MIVWKLRPMVYNTHTSQPNDANLLKDKVVIVLTSKMVRCSHGGANLNLRSIRTLMSFVRT